ncbi:MAG: hypothetical protein Q8L44_09660 [Sulfuritalea sp.]|nr:hypothetical protein [Sulfuritalea sp.]
MISVLIASLTSALIGNRNLPYAFEHLDIKFADELGRTVAIDLLSEFVAEEGRNHQTDLVCASLEAAFAPCDKQFVEAFAISFSNHFGKIIEVGINAVQGEGDQS